MSTLWLTKKLEDSGIYLKGPLFRCICHFTPYLPGSHNYGLCEVTIVCDMSRKDKDILRCSLAHMNKRYIKELVKDSAYWVSYEQEEKVESLNKMVMQMWPFYERAICKQVCQFLGCMPPRSKLYFFHLERPPSVLLHKEFHMHYSLSYGIRKCSLMCILMWILIESLKILIWSVRSCTMGVRQIIATVEPLLDRFKPAFVSSIKFNKLTFGDMPFKFTHMKIVRVTDDEVVLEAGVRLVKSLAPMGDCLDFRLVQSPLSFNVSNLSHRRLLFHFENSLVIHRWGGEAHVAIGIQLMGGAFISPSVRRLNFFAKTRITLTRFAPKIPCFGAVLVSLQKPPMVICAINAPVTAMTFSDLLQKVFHSWLDFTHYWKDAAGSQK